MAVSAQIVGFATGNPEFLDLTYMPPGFTTMVRFQIRRNKSSWRMVKRIYKLIQGRKS